MELQGEKYWSHPNKPLITHINGVINNAKKLSENTTANKWAELTAIFHDLGKINPNFQEKLKPIPNPQGYANHAYMSAYSFFVAFGCVKANKDLIVEWLGVDKISQNDLIALTIIIAKHHGHLPDFCPIDIGGVGVSILSKDENKLLHSFLNERIDLPIEDYSKFFFTTLSSFNQILRSEKVQIEYIEKLLFDADLNKKALDFYLDTQFAFSCLIHGDKTDAAKFDSLVESDTLIDENRNNVKVFCKSYQSQLNEYLSKLNQESELNRLRTEMRQDSVQNIKIGLKNNKRVFELTSPTGSGKTLMLLSLASEVMGATKKDLRIIYALPFLSITEQVEAEVLRIFAQNKDFIQRIDSKSQNKQFDDLQKKLDEDPTEEDFRKMNLLEFMESTFAYPFIITTFVRFFETLLSNQNSELLKLPNFSRCIFLLDEIQALPPRLYGFFVAYLTRFCEKYDSYAVISTATQPDFELPEKLTKDCENTRYVKSANEFFKKSETEDYKKPYPILSLKYFENDLFNRYQINYDKELIDIQTLKNRVIEENQSTLVILNTIDDTKDLYKAFLDDGFSKDEVFLLNTHFTPNHRKIKIYLVKRRLKQKKRIILISTQLIEAGVDIDFPVLYRDFAIVASIIQSAGRCNRNGKLENEGKTGQVKLFRLAKNGRPRAEVIYRGLDKEILRITKEEFTKTKYEEKTLIDVQKAFFTRIKDELNFAEHKQAKFNQYFNFLKDIQECQFSKIGKFQLIDEQEYGEAVQYFVPKNDQDNKFEQLLILKNELDEILRTRNSKVKPWELKKKIQLHLKKMSGQIIQLRLKPNHYKPILANNEAYFDYLFKISELSYSFEKGVNLLGDDNIF